MSDIEVEMEARRRCFRDFESYDQNMCAFLPVGAYPGHIPPMLIPVILGLSIEAFVRGPVLRSARIGGGA